MPIRECIFLLLVFISTRILSAEVIESESLEQPLTGTGKNILAIVSDRSSGSLVAGAHHFLEQSPQHSINIRSVSQVNLMSDANLKQLVNRADALLLVAVFAEPVERLLNLSYPKQQTRIAINSDCRLLNLHSDPYNSFQKGLFTRLSSDEKKSLFKRLTGDYSQQLKQQQKRWPEFAYWLQAKAYWQNRNVENRQSIFSLLLQENSSHAEKSTIAKQASWPSLHEAKSVRFYQGANKQISEGDLSALLKQAKIPTVFFLDHDSGDRPGDWQLHQQLCQRLAVKLASKNNLCISVLSAWGEASIEAMTSVSKLVNSANPFVIISLQDFVVGGGDGRSEVTELFAQMNVPVFKGIRITEIPPALYDLSSQGIPANSVHYRIAMPELQGIGQGHVLALAAPMAIDEMTGAQVAKTEPVSVEIDRLISRIGNWLSLKTKANQEKKIAIVFYNHPPGRHNIGADNLNVPETLWQMLNELKQQGYDLGPEKAFPKNANELLDQLQLKAVNLPEDAQALKTMSPLIHNMKVEDYLAWFETLPMAVQQEMQQGPLGYMHERIKYFLFAEGHEYLLTLSNTQRQQILTELYEMMDATMHDLHHALDGIRHNGRERGLRLLDQLELAYIELIDAQKQNIKVHSESQLKTAAWQQAVKIKQAILAMQIEGIRGWGQAPGKTMVWQNQLLIPGIQLGNVFLGPQPPRGWEINEELLHANMSFPPPHQYLAFYKYLAQDFAADALVHVGRHSTYEFLPKRGAGLLAMDYPSIVAQDIPSIYPYIVDGVGEGIQAKRRGLAIMVDHLTPPLAVTELYDGLLQLRQLIESAEAASDEVTQQKAIKALRLKIDELNLRDELIASMDEELLVRGVGFSEVDDDFLLHEVGHYLTHLQEEFMPLGLHVFGRDWSQESISIMLESMMETDGVSAALDESDFNDENAVMGGLVRENLIQSPKAEMNAFINALNGGFVVPGKGNDPIRTPQALPTGRNFYALDGSLLPTQLGVEIGQQLAAKARQENAVVFQQGPRGNNTIAEKEAVILWASDAVRDEGAMIAFGLDMLGIKPIWNSRGIIKSLELLPLTQERQQRRDVVFTSSGLFRDLYGSQLELLDKSVLLALAASRDTIARDYPALSLMLLHALSPIADLIEALDKPSPAAVGVNTGLRNKSWAQESLEQNLIARNWVYEARALLVAHPDADANVLARQASLRVFGTAPGAYGAGINRLAERSGAWQDRKQLGEVFIKRMGHAYGVESKGLNSGAGAQALFKAQLNHVGNTYLGRASNLYGLIDNNDAFDYLGGLNLAIETVTGEQPNSFVISHANQQNMKMDSLQKALLAELRGRFLNPQWIKPLMQDGYAGARTMGSEFVEYLWGWQVTSPEIIQSWVWQDVKSVYIDDSLNLGLDDFLAENHNVHVQTNILAIMLVAIDKGFWQADELTQQGLAQKFAKNIIEKGIPGSGHTHANHPIYESIKPLLTSAQVEKLEQVLSASRLDFSNQDQNQEQDQVPNRIQEISLTLTELEQADLDKAEHPSSSNSAEDDQQIQPYLLALLLAAWLLILVGFIRSRRL